VASATPHRRLLSQPQGTKLYCLVSGDRGMCVNNLPRVALDSGVASIQTHDWLIASPVSQPLRHWATQR